MVLARMEEDLGGIWNHVRACADRCKGMAAIGESEGADLSKGSSDERFRLSRGLPSGRMRTHMSVSVDVTGQLDESRHLIATTKVSKKSSEHQRVADSRSVAQMRCTGIANLAPRSRASRPQDAIIVGWTWP